MPTADPRLPGPPPIADPAPVAPGHTFASVTETVSDIALTRPTSRGWPFRFAVSAVLVAVLVYVIGLVLVVGVGVWGVNVPVGWGFAIVNFVWWIGIAHAGSLLTAVLLLARQEWRAGFNRYAKGVALAALVCAGLFPLLHMGRPWFFYWLLPYPSTHGVWPQFRSSLVWDVFALLTYLVVAGLFAYVGLLPDLATLRDRARGRLAGTAYAVLAMGWRGDAGHWRRHRVAYRLMAGLAIATVLSLVTSFDFASAVVPGWHFTLHPVFLLAGIVLSGTAMILMLLIPLRARYGLGSLVTDPDLHGLARLLLAASLGFGWAHLSRGFIAWVGGPEPYREQIRDWVVGEYAGMYWAMLAANVAVPQALWSRWVRSQPALLWAVGLTVLVGTWLDKYLLVIAPLSREYVVSAWGLFDSTVWDWATFVGTIGLFAALILLFVRLLPVVSMAEVREHLPHPGSGEPAGEQPIPTRPLNGPAYGLLAEYDSEARLVDAIRRAKAAGYSVLEAFAPVPVPAVWDDLGYRRTWLPAVAAAAGAAGAVLAYLVQAYANVWDYPLNVGGRPLSAFGNWPAFNIVTIQVAILAATVATFGGMLLRNGLPMPHHPLFNVPEFRRASQTRFFLCVRATDPRFDADGTRRFLTGLEPLGVWDVPIDPPDQREGGE